MTNNLFDGLVLFGPYFVAPHSDVVLFFDEKNTLFPKTTSKRPWKKWWLEDGSGFFKWTLFKEDVFHFRGRVGLEKIKQNLWWFRRKQSNDFFHTGHLVVTSFTTTPTIRKLIKCDRASKLSFFWGVIFVGFSEGKMIVWRSCLVKSWPSKSEGEIW